MGDRCTELSECFQYLNFNAPISSIPHLNDFDVDLHVPSNTNFRYFTTHDFHSDYEIGECLKGKDCFAALHCNIRSLQANIDNFYNMLSQLSCPFSVIGLSETKINTLHPVLNTNISGYHFLSQPSLSMAGGVGFYSKNDLSYTICSDLTVSKIDFEAIWIEIDNSRGSM